MVTAVKDVCIFMIIVQAVLCFTPGNSYEKYIRILVGILMVLRITEPVFGFFMNEETKMEIQNKVRIFQEELENQTIEIGIGNPDIGIYSSIEEELKRKVEGCSDNYVVGSVELSGMELSDGSLLSGDSLQVTITVIPNSNAGEEEMKLQELYGNCLGVTPEQIQIVYANRSGRQRGGKSVKR